MSSTPQQLILKFLHNQKNPRVRKILVRNSGAGNGCANFMDTWKKCLLSAGKSHVHKIPRFLGGGILGFGEGGECRFYYYGRGDFSDTTRKLIQKQLKCVSVCVSVIENQINAENKKECVQWSCILVSPPQTSTTSVARSQPNMGTVVISHNRALLKRGGP